MAAKKKPETEAVPVAPVKPNHDADGVWHEQVMDYVVHDGVLVLKRDIDTKSAPAQTQED